MSNKENAEKIEITESKTELPVKAPGKKTSTKKTAPKAELTEEQNAPKIASQKKKITPVDRNELVEVRSCVYGELNYVSRSTGNRITWKTFDDPNWVTVGDLMEMRNSQRDFFEKNWIVLVGDNAKDVMQYLQVDRYYKMVTNTENFDDIFKYSPDEIPGVVSKLSESMKETVARRAYALIQNHELDSRTMITALEEALGYDLTDPQ